ncbi:hypothetical protein Emag_006038 [Eimeria magna]
MSLQRSQKLTEIGAKALAAAQADEAARNERQVALWESSVIQAEEAKQRKKAALLQELAESRDQQVATKKRAKERQKKEDAEYAESIRLAAAAADAEEQRERKQQRAVREKVRLQQEEQARMKAQHRTEERKRRLREERDIIDGLSALELEVQQFAERGTAAAKKAGAEWFVLERARQKLLRQSVISRPVRGSRSGGEDALKDESLPNSPIS